MAVATAAPLLLALLLSSAALSAHAQTGKVLRPGDPGLKEPTPGPDGQYPDFPLQLKLSAKREGDKAVGTATITNPLKDTVEIPSVNFDIRFDDGDTKSYKDDIRQDPIFTMCGSTKLPTTLAPGAKLECPFKSRDNIYKGPIRVVADVPEFDEKLQRTVGRVAHDVVDCPVKDGAACTQYVSP